MKSATIDQRFSVLERVSNKSAAGYPPFVFGFIVGIVSATALAWLFLGVIFYFSGGPGI